MANKTIQLTPDDVFELKRLRERAEVESRDFKYATNPVGGRHAFTDTARDAMHSVEALNRILKQV